MEQMTGPWPPGTYEVGGRLGETGWVVPRSWCKHEEAPFGWLGHVNKIRSTIPRIGDHSVPGGCAGVHTNGHAGAGVEGARGLAEPPRSIPGTERTAHERGNILGVGQEEQDIVGVERRNRVTFSSLG